MKIVNRGRVNYEYKIGIGQPLIKETKYSNAVKTLVIDQRIKMIKKVDKQYASVFEIITYTIIIQNISTINIEQLIMKDKTPPGMRFIFNSVYIDGEKKRGVNLNKGLILNGLKAAESKIITFKTVIMPECFYKNIKNFSFMEYGYIYNVDLPPIMVKIKSNEVTTRIKNSLFNQLTHGTKLYFRDGFGGEVLKRVSVKNVKICPLINKIIKCNHGYRVLVIGKITYEIDYITNRRSRVRTCFDVEGFSCLLSVPEGVKYCEIEHISAEIEDVTIQFMGRDTVFLTTLYIIKII